MMHPPLFKFRVVPAVILDLVRVCEPRVLHRMRVVLHRRPGRPLRGQLHLLRHRLLTSKQVNNAHFIEKSQVK